MAIHESLIDALQDDTSRQYKLVSVNGDVTFASASSPQDAMAQQARYDGTTIVTVTDKMRATELLKTLTDGKPNVEHDEQVDAGGKDSSSGVGKDNKEA